MKGGTLQIAWHDSKPVLTLDFHRLTGLLATGGADFDIKFWSLHSSENKKEIVRAVYEYSYSYHNFPVNIVRFSPSGEQLASGADGGEIILWRFQNTEGGNSWKVMKSLSFHRKDVLDVQWSPDGAFLISGSVDNSCIIWDAAKGTVQQILESHAHYVQGVAWDPAGQYVASISSDRTCKIYLNKPKNAKGRGQERMNYVCQHIISKAESERQENDQVTKFHLFHDETLPSFFRRLEWSPDGSFLVVPAGILKCFPHSSSSNAAHVFSRKDFSRPASHIPGGSKPVVAVRFCPLVFKLNKPNPEGPFKLPYRVVFALATLNSLYIYDTESSAPVGIYAGLHYAAITDIAWSFDAKFLAVSSQDCYCTIIEFEDGDLGSPVPHTELPSHVASYMARAVSDTMPLEAEDMETEIPISGLEKLEQERVDRREDIDIPMSEANLPELSKNIAEMLHVDCNNVPQHTRQNFADSSDKQEAVITKDGNASTLSDCEVQTGKPSKKRITPIAL